MGVFRRQYQSTEHDGRIVKRQSRNYYYGITGPDGIREIKSTGVEDKKSAMMIENQRRLDLERGAAGVDQAYRKSKKLMVGKLIDQFVEHLTTLERVDMHCRNTEWRLRKIAGEAAWLTLGDITLASFERWRNEFRQKRYRGQQRTAKTVNQYVAVARQFVSWAKAGGLVAINPLQEVVKAVETPNPSYRRRLTPDEFDRIISKVECPEEKLYYIFRVWVPLRTRAVDNLRWRDLHLDDPRPWADVPAEINKSRQREKNAIRADLAEALREFRNGADDSELVFCDPIPLATWRSRVEAAGLAFCDEHGRNRLDYHSLRGTFIFWCKLAGVPLEVACLALHHKDIKTTRKHYDHSEAGKPMTEAVEVLPPMAGMPSFGGAK